jgi:diguanylate cyclase (GGDEF)-like protein
MLSADPRLPRTVRWCWLLLVHAAVAYVAVLAYEHLGPGEVLPIGTHEMIQFALLAVAAGLIVTRAVKLRERRAAWLVLGGGMTIWTVGQLVSGLQSPAGEQPPFPSAVDFALMAFYVTQYVALFLLARSGVRAMPRSAWLDGAITMLLLGGVAAHWLVEPLMHHGGSLSAIVVTIVYPTADAMLLVLVTALFALHGWRPGRTWLLIGAGLAATLVGDASFALQSVAATGTEPNVTTGPLAVFYALGALSLVAAAMVPPGGQRDGDLAGWKAMAGPLVFCGVVVAMLVFDSFSELAPSAEILLTIAVALICLRAGLAFRENISLSDSHRQAMTDELTGLPNRRSAYLELDERCGMPDPVSVLMIDLDRFKELNDTLGHLAGDDALIAVAGRLQAAIGGVGRLSRLGGDEFAVVLGHGGEREAMSAARRVLDALDEPLQLDDLLLPVRASIGVAGVPVGTDSSREELLRHADVAMYHAKSTGSGVEVYASERDGHSRARLALAAELQDAITNGSLTLHFQPKASLRTGAIVGVEALVRWQHPERGLLPPAEFVPLVERSGLGRMLTLEVIDQALRAERAWRAEGLELTVAVNTSAATLLDVRFPDDVAGLLQRWAAPAGVLGLELTEETIMTDPQRAQDVLARLSEIGVDLSLDDFGTGYSSLSMLKRLPVRELKIDRSFVMGILDDRGDAAIVRSTVDLARNLGLRVVAEGVESAEAWDLLARWGCDLAQGYHLSRPIPLGELLALLQAQSV